MHFSGVSLHSNEIGVCQPNAYDDVQSHHSMSSTPCIPYQLQNINTIGRAGWDISPKEQKIDNVKIKIITFDTELVVKSIVAPYNKG